MKVFLILQAIFLALPAFAKNIEGNELRQIMQTIGITKNETYSGNDWSQLTKIYPNVKWKNIEDKEYSDAKSGSTISRQTKFDITAKGVRSMIFEIEATTFGYYDSGAFRNQLEALGTQVKTVCLDEMNAATTGFAWYQISSKEFNPIYVSISWTAGSGGSGETIKLSLKPTKNSCTTKNYWKNENTSLAVKSTDLGYLTGKIETFVGAGCEYYLASDDKKKTKKIIGSEDFSHSGIILNIEGKDILVKGRTDSRGAFLGAYDTTTLRIPAGKSKVNGESGSKTQTFFNLNSSGTVTQTSVVGYCYD